MWTISLIITYTWNQGENMGLHWIDLEITKLD